MSFSTRATRVLAALTPLGVALAVAGTVLLVGWDRGVELLIPGFVLMAGGVAAAHTILGPRYGNAGFFGFAFTEVSFILIALFGIGFITLALASPLLAYALVKMTPPLRPSAAALVAVWPLAAFVAAATSLVFLESIATVFPLPYALFALEALRVPRA